MPKPLRQRVARPLAPESVKRKLAGEDKVDEQLMLTTAVGGLDDDTEAKLRRLRYVASKEADYKKERESLRDELTPILEDGSRLFVDSDGHKYYGYNVSAEDTVIDADLLKQLIDADLYEELVTDKVDLKKFRVACAAGRIPDDVMVKVTSFKSKAAHVRFGVASQ